MAERHHTVKDMIAGPRFLTFRPKAAEASQGSARFRDGNHIFEVEADIYGALHRMRLEQLDPSDRFVKGSARCVKYAVRDEVTTPGLPNPLVMVGEVHFERILIQNVLNYQAFRDVLEKAVNKLCDVLHGPDPERPRWSCSLWQMVVTAAAKIWHIRVPAISLAATWLDSSLDHPGRNGTSILALQMQNPNARLAKEARTWVKYTACHTFELGHSQVSTIRSVLTFELPPSPFHPRGRSDVG
ncbi:hypothetical protein JCM10212_002906 [Sporobolomyces blumeae]